jgi:CP family cyanate transporter-like MFS transporter
MIVKQHFRTRVGTMTGLYTVALNVGATGAAAATVPLTEGVFGGDWRLGLACWAGLALLALPSWLPV